MKKLVLLITTITMLFALSSCLAIEPPSQWHFGAGEPSVQIGNDGDFYLSSTDFQVYAKGNGVWTSLGTIKGVDGTPGKDGVDGTPGKDGVDGAPGKDGVDGAPGKDGVDGAPGKDGVDGAPGENGMDAASWHSGKGIPRSTVGADGDFYLNTKDLCMYKKVNGSWEFLCYLGDTPDMNKDHNYKILFIGNSYTFYNDMPTAIFEKIAKAAGYTVEIESVTKGGWSLEKHADPNDEVGAKVEEKLSASDADYDFVILQEQSHRPVTNSAAFYDGARNLVERIRAIGAEPVFYSTWGRKTGSETLDTYNLTNESMTWGLAAAYNAIADELAVDRVACAGLAFFDVYNAHTEIELYNSDKSHPSYEGSFLAALTLFTEIFRIDVKNLTYRGTLSDGVYDVLAQAAADAVFVTPEIPEEYRTTSVGVTSAYYPDTSKQSVLTAIPASNRITVLGEKDKVASSEYSTTALTDAQKADIADIRYGISVIGVEKMSTEFKGYTTAIENLVNGDFGKTLYSFLEFDGKKYDISGNAVANGKYKALYTLNLGESYSLDAIGFASGSAGGVPSIAEVYVSSDGESWTLVPTAVWDTVNGNAVDSCTNASSYEDESGNTTGYIALFDAEGVEAKYVRIAVVSGRKTSPDTVNTKEILVFGEKTGE